MALTLLISWSTSVRPLGNIAMAAVLDAFCTCTSMNNVRNERK